MPYMRLETNLELEDNTANELTVKASARLSTLLGKSENYVLIQINPSQTMLFAGSPEPLAYVELKSIGLPTSQAPTFSKALCDFIAEELNIAANRVYIEFTDIPRELWGWNGKTFA